MKKKLITISMLFIVCFLTGCEKKPQKVINLNPKSHRTIIEFQCPNESMNNGKTVWVRAIGDQ